MRISLIATAVISSALALILGEIALRLIGFEFALYPTQIQFGAPDPVRMQRVFQVDRDLLWVTKDYYAKVARWKGERPSIVFMGDSCTQFGRYDEFLASMILDHDRDSTFTFVNVGTGGWSSYQGLKQLERDILPMAPRAISIYYGWNDHWTSFGVEDKIIGNFNLEHPAFLLKISKLRVVQLINRAIWAFKQPTPGERKRKPERVSLSDFTANLRQMVELARDGGIIPILLTAPSFHRKGEEPQHLASRWLNDLRELIPLHQTYVQAVRTVASKERAPLIDLYAEFNRLPPGELSKLFYSDGIHLTEEGNKKIADFIFEYLVRNDLYDRLVDAPPASARAATRVRGGLRTASTRRPASRASVSGS